MATNYQTAIVHFNLLRRCGESLNDTWEHVVTHHLVVNE